MKVKCKACGKRFMPCKERVYQAQEILLGLSTLTGKAPNIYDATDCPRCSSQVLLNIRIPALKERNIENEAESNA